MNAVFAAATTALSVVIASAGAQEPIRRVALEEALGLFATNNLELRIARASAAETAGGARQASAYPNPTLSLSHEAIGNGIGNYRETYLNLSQRLDWPWVAAARGQSANHRQSAGRAQVTADSVRLANEMRRVFVEGAAAEEMSQALEGATQMVRRAEQQATERAGAGDVSGYELRRLRIERARYENELRVAILRTHAARLRLANLILPEGGGEIAPASLPAGQPPALALDPILLAAERIHPEISQTRFTIAASREGRRAAGAERFPSPILTAGYKQQSDGMRGAFLSAGLSFPLFDRRGAGVAAATAQQQSAEARGELVARRVVGDIRTAFAAYAAARARIAFLDGGNLAASDTLLGIARVAYAEGEMTLVELLDAVDAYRLAGAAVIDARANLWIAFYDLERAAGVSLATLAATEGR
ncbi:MAG: TolC family protein [Gemmatimonadetes bacterium]|nr:TolC family protein [Gemmatimonadota bacterium]